MDELMNIVRRWQSNKVMVVGDLYADIFMDCKIARVSREAPVFVLEPTDEKLYLGAAANVIHNGVTLGGNIFAAGIIGNDAPGVQLRELLAEKNIDEQHVIDSAAQHTITKQRITAWDLGVARQHIARIDRVPKKGFSAEDAQKMTENLIEHIAEMDAVVLSDYGNGTLREEGIRKILERCQSAGVPSFVDSRYAIAQYAGVGYVKQNEAELASYNGCDEFASDSEIFSAGRKLLNALDATAVMITLGARGAALIERSGECIVSSLSKAEVSDVSGAGDTFTVTMALAVTAGAALQNAVRIANAAAGVVVRKAGTATVNVEELLHELKNEANVAEAGLK